MKKKSFLFAAVAVIGLTLLFTACSKIPDNTGDELTKTGKSSLLASTTDKDCNFTAVLSEDEITGLLHIREEEKVARDVYLKFYEIYGKVIFKNIAASEQKHMDAVLALIVGYGLTDPASADYGKFTTVFQVLYDGLITRGSTSLEEAFQVGVDIEEMDIVDLNEFLLSAEVTKLLEVYTKLLSASENHLSAFQAQL
jgi:hypothetical protein